MKEAKEAACELFNELLTLMINTAPQMGKDFIIIREVRYDKCSELFIPQQTSRHVSRAHLVYNLVNLFRILLETSKQ